MGFHIHDNKGYSCGHFWLILAVPNPAPNINKKPTKKLKTKTNKPNKHTYNKYAYFKHSDILSLQTVCNFLHIDIDQMFNDSIY